MKKRIEQVAALDAFMAARKHVLVPDRRSRWESTHVADEVMMRWPLEAGGEITPQASLAITGNPRRRDGLFFRLHLFTPFAVSRLDYTDETHANSMGGQVAGLSPLVVGPHYHSWELNKRFFNALESPPELHDAEEYYGAGRAFDAILRWYCDACNIEPLPPDHRIELPRLVGLL